MLSIKRILSLLTLTFCLSSYAQLYKTHDWEDNPKYFELSEEENTLASVAIKEKYLIQYYQKVFKAGSPYRLFETKHSIIRVNTDKGVEKHNKVYIPMRDVSAVKDIKARVIRKDGKITVFNKNNIKVLENVEEYGNFKIFAPEGVVKDSQLEFIYTVEKEIRAVGSVVIQKDYKIKEAEVIIRKPKSLSSEIKPYNGFPDFKKQEVEGNKVASVARKYDIPAMIDEGSATPDANRMKVSYVVRTGYSSDMWNGLNSGIRGRYINVKARKIKNLVSEFEKFKQGKSGSENDLNLMVEFVNGTFQKVKNSSPAFDDINYILSKKQASSQGIVKVYTALCNHYNIKFQVVLTSDRFNHKFDQHFYSGFNLQELLLYFPKYDKYIVPSHVNSRLDHAPYEYISNMAIFISPVTYDFDEISVPETQYTLTKRDFNLSITKDGQGKVECHQELTGYKASDTRRAYKYFKKEDIDRFKEYFVTSGIEDAEVSQFEVAEEDLNSITENKPFVMDWTLTSEIMVEQVGVDIVFNIGMAIGQQAEFYQEVERVNPVEIRFPNEYTYHFKIKIPEGYKPAGLENLKIDKKVLIKGNNACSFISDYQLDEGYILVDVNETYNLLKMDLEYYEGYKNVVNAAYDFSKLGILFEKNE